MEENAWTWIYLGVGIGLGMGFVVSFYIAIWLYISSRYGSHKEAKDGS